MAPKEKEIKQNLAESNSSGYNSILFVHEIDSWVVLT